MIQPPKLASGADGVGGLTGKSFIHFLFAVGPVKPGGQQTIELADFTNLDQVVQHVSVGGEGWRRD